MRPLRNRGRERRLLLSAERDAGPSGFAAHALRRLELGEVLYADRWAGEGIERLLEELLEEAADLGGWACLALAALEADPPPVARRRDVVASVAYAIGDGARAHARIAAALAALADAEEAGR